MDEPINCGKFFTVVMVRYSPTPAICNPETNTFRMAALLAGPDCRLLSLRMAGVDPKENSEVKFVWHLKQPEMESLGQRASIQESIQIMNNVEQ